MATKREPAVPFRLILLLGLFLWGGEYARRDIWDPDEARYTLVAKDMRAGGHWLVPFRQGEYYAHKPPLMFWLTNAFSLLTGGEIGRVAPRLPSFLGALLSLWAVSRLATRWFSARAGGLAVLVLATSFLFWNKGGFGQIDALLCGLEMAGLYFLFTRDDTPGPRRTAAAYALFGLAILAKGPVGLLVPLAVYAAAMWAAGEGRFLRARHWLWGPPLALAFPATWLLLAWWQGAPPGYLHELLFSQNAGRVAGEFGGHREPFYYFLQYLPLDFLPWTLVLPLALSALRRVPEARPGVRRLIAWAAAVVLVFSLSASKRNLYILLAYPAAAMLVAAALDHLPRAPARAWRLTTGPLSLFPLLAGVALLVAGARGHLPFDGRALWPAGIALLAGGAWCWRRRAQMTGPGLTWLHAFALTFLGAWSMVGAFVYPALNDVKTPRAIVAPAQALLGPSDRIIMYKCEGEIVSLYTGRAGFMAPTLEDVERFLASAPQQHHLVVARDRDLPEVQARLHTTAAVVPFRSGGKKLAWLSIDKSPPTS